MVVDRRSRRLAALCAAAVLASCVTGPRPTGRAAACGDPSEICGLHSPEDLADLPGTPWVLVSQQDAKGSSGLSALNTISRRIVDYPIAIPPAQAAGSACAPSLAPRYGGMGVRRLGASYRVVVIDHAAPERVDVFAVTPGGDAPSVRWMACVPVPPPLFLNDLAPLPDGGFVATHMYDRGLLKGEAKTKAFLSGAPTGYLVRWSPATGWSIVAGAEGAFPNGVDVSADGQTAYMAETYGRRVDAAPLTSGPVRRISVDMQPDNVTVAPDGTVVVAGGTGKPVQSTKDCAALRDPGCGFPSAVLRLDFRDGTVRRLFSSDGRRTPGASVGVIKGQTLYIGTSFGDRITTVPVGGR